LSERRREFEFAAIRRRGEQELARIRDQFGFRIACEDYQDVLGAGMEIVVVASPAALRYEIAAAALATGAAPLSVSRLAAHGKQLLGETR